MSTEQPKPLQGYRESQEIKKENSVDPKRFQEELSKVQESDASQQQKKRNLKKSEEESDDESLAKQQIIEASGALFLGFIKDSDASSLSPQTPQNIRGSAAPTSSSAFTIEQDTSNAPALAPIAEEPIQGAPAPSISLATQAPLPPIPQVPIQEMPQAQSYTASEQQVAQPIETPSSLPPTYTEPPAILTYASTEDGSEQDVTTPQDQPPQRVEKKEIPQDTSLFSKYKTSKAQALKKKQETTPGIHLQKQEKTPAEPLKPQVSEKTEKQKPMPSKPAPLVTIAPEPLGAKAAEPLEGQDKLTIAESRQALLKQTPPLSTPQPLLAIAPPTEKKTDAKTKDSSSLESLSSAPTIKTQSDSHDDSSKDKKDKDKESEAAVALTPITAPVTFTPPPTPEVPAYATLTPEVYELFERMVGMITIQNAKGITTTTVTINMKGSIFDGAKIVLDHYSSAPNAFNVTIATAPNAQATLTSNIDNLAAAFQASKLSFEINMKKPILLEEHQTLVKRKGNVGDEPEEQNQQG